MPRSSIKYDENPARLTRLLRSIRRDIFKESQALMAERLNSVERLRGKNTFSGELIKNIENGRRIITYYHISVYADLLEIPTGVLILFSRYSVTQIHQDRAFEEFNMILEKFLSISNARLKNGGALAISDLEDMSAFVKKTTISTSE